MHPWVQIDLAGFPLFAVQVRRDEFVGSDQDVFFESEDCAGQGWTRLEATAWGNAIRLLDSPTSTTFYISDPLELPETIFVKSQLRNSGECEAQNDVERPARRVMPLDLDSVFAPPFRVVTRGDL